jgi:hypothetical protein
LQDPRLTKQQQIDSLVTNRGLNEVKGISDRFTVFKTLEPMRQWMLSDVIVDSRDARQLMRQATALEVLWHIRHSHIMAQHPNEFLLQPRIVKPIGPVGAVSVKRDEMLEEREDKSDSHEDGGIWVGMAEISFPIGENGGDTFLERFS